MYTTLAWNAQSPCLSLSNAEIASKYHYIPVEVEIFLLIKNNQKIHAGHGGTQEVGAGE